MNVGIDVILLAAQAGGGGGGTQLIFLLAAIMVMFYFIVLRPQQREKKEMQQMLDNVKVGDRIVTIGGIHGTIKEVKDAKKTLVIQVDKNTRLEINRSAVGRVVTKDDDKDEAKASTTSDESDKKK